MPHDLATLQLSGMTALGAELRRMAENATSMERVAQRIVRHLYEEMVDAPTGERNCVLVRFYRTLPYGALDEDLRAFGARLMEGHALTPSTPCLTLLASAGDLPAWNDRRQSKGHRTIPLPSEQVVAKFPMVSHLIAQLGLSVGSVVRPDPGLMLELEQHTYNVFFVPEATGSPYIPAQEDFVTPHGIHSVLGFGGLLPGGDVFATLMFTRTHIARSTADIFRNAAMNVKVALLPFADGPVFEAP